MSAFIHERVKDKSVLVFVPILECLMQIFHVCLLNVSPNSCILIYPGSGLDWKVLEVCTSHFKRFPLLILYILCDSCQF